MTVERIEIRRIEVPLLGPLAAAHDTQRARSSILIGASDGDGRTGWGECVALARPTYTSEWIDGAWTVLTDLLVPALLAGRDSGVVGHPMAQAALDSAVVDLALQVGGRSLADELGSVDRVASRAVIGIHDDPDQVVGDVATCIELGHRSVKLKVDPQIAERHVAAVRARWADLDLAVDANGTFDLERDAEMLRRLDGWNLTYLEQPLPAGDLLGHADLRRRGSTPIALDESITGIGTFAAADALGALDLVNVKPARLGGLAATRGLLTAMAESGTGGFCGGMYELGIARAVALAVAGMPQLCGRPTDLGPSDSYVPRDVTQPHLLRRDGTISVPEGPGIGRRPDLEFVDGVTCERVELRR